MKRLDVLLTELQIVPSRAKAQELISSGAVEIFENGQWRICTQPSHKCSTQAPDQIRVAETELLQFVARSGLKLDGALAHLNLSVVGFDCLDVGQSTGGFTDCLLQRGAKSVVGVDVGTGQLAPKLQSDLRVTAFEKLHAKDVAEHEWFQAQSPRFDMIVIDVSFISVTKIISPILQYLKADGYFLSLIKPQFELGPAALNKRGVVEDPKVLAQLETTIRDSMAQFQFAESQYFASALKGRDGNQEFFFYGKKVF